MPIINPDTSEAVDMSAIEPGTYPAKIVEVASQVSKQGNPMIVPKFQVTVDGKRRIRKSYLVITGEGAYGFDQLLRATGFSDIADQYKNPSVNPKPPFDTDSLIGQELMVKIDSEMYENELRDQIKGYLPA